MRTGIRASAAAAVAPLAIAPAEPASAQSSSEVQLGRGKDHAFLNGTVVGHQIVRVVVGLLLIANLSGMNEATGFPGRAQSGRWGSSGGHLAASIPCDWPQRTRSMV